MRSISCTIEPCGFVHSCRQRQKFSYALGESVVGVTHECDYPPEAQKKPPLIRPRVDPQASPAAIDREVTELVSRGESIYAVDADLLASLAPDLIITQDLCHVCAASPEDLATTLTRFSKRPKILSLTPHSLTDVWEDIRRIGEATGRRRDAQGLAITLAQRVAAIEMKVATARGRASSVSMDGSVLHRRALGARNGREGGRPGRIGTRRRAVVSGDSGANRRSRCGDHRRDAVWI